jgi:hypothetical protein
MAVRVSVLAPVTSLALAEALSPGELAERAAATFGVEAKSLTFFRLVELKEEAAAPLAGHFACAVESSGARPLARSRVFAAAAARAASSHACAPPVGRTLARVY